VTADLAGMLLGALSISGLTVSVGLHGSTYNPHVLNCALSLVISAIIDLSYVLFHKHKKKKWVCLHLPALTWFHLKIIVSISTVLLAHERWPILITFSLT
jgi:hypothetical protein